MTPPEHPDAPLTPAERRLEEHLELLRTGGPSASTELVHSVVRAVRWQRLIRRPLMVLARFAGAAGEGLRLLFGSPSQRS